MEIFLFEIQIYTMIKMTDARKLKNIWEKITQEDPKLNKVVVYDWLQSHYMIWFV